MIRLNPEQDNEAATAIRWAREKHPYLTDVQAAVSVWSSFRNCFYNYHEFLEVVTQGMTHRYGEFADVIASYERRWERTEGVTELVRRRQNAV